MKRYAIIVSEKDAAGMNIRDKLLAGSGFTPDGSVFDGGPVYSRGPETRLYTIKDDTVFAEGIDSSIDADVLIFATRHQAAAGTSTLSVHVPGNFGAADFGGESGWLCAAPAILMKRALVALRSANDAGFEVTMEATHHGPRLEKPAMFVEIGSSEAQWVNGRAGEIIASAIVGVVSGAGGFEEATAAAGCAIAAAGIGGPHYCAAFNDLALDSRYAIGHVCPKYAVDRLDEAMIRQMAEKTAPAAGLFIIDWKGVRSAARARIIGIVEKLGYAYIRA